MSAAKIVFDQQRGEDIEVARKEVQNAALECQDHMQAHVLRLVGLQDRDVELGGFRVVSAGREQYCSDLFNPDLLRSH